MERVLEVINIFVNETEIIEEVIVVNITTYVEVTIIINETVLLEQVFHNTKVNNIFIFEDVTLESNRADIGGAYGVEGISPLIQSSTYLNNKAYLYGDDTQIGCFYGEQKAYLT